MTKSAVVAALVLSGCYIGDHYSVTPATEAQLARATAEERRGLVVPARRADGREVWLRASTVKSEGPGRAFARAPSARVTAGSVLTWVGSAISIGGTLLFFLTDGGDAHWAGAGLAGGAEPIMLAGTLLWVFGALQHPEIAPAPGN